MKASSQDVDKKPSAGSVLCKDYERAEWLDWTNCPYQDEVAVFRFFLAEATTLQLDWPALLHPNEIMRGERYHRSGDRLRSLCTRSLLRILVGKYTNQDPLAIRLTKGARNKPELPDNPEWHLNATHSGDWILLSVGKSSVGVDVEEIKPDFGFEDVIPTSFSTQERQYIEADGNAPNRFYELWTRKEAFVKAIGSGIDETFSQIPSLTGLHELGNARFAAAGKWITDSFHVAKGYSAAIAYGYSSGQPVFYTLDPNVFTLQNKPSERRS